MKYKIVLIGIFTQFLGSIVIAQPENYMEKIEAIRKDFFTDKLELTSDEAAKFWPIYKDFNNRREKINEDRRILFRYINRNSDFLTDKEIDESLEKYINFQKEETLLTEQFNKKFLEILPPKKVLRIYITENQFKAYILNQIRENRPANGLPGRVK
jgi:hypothetical protein